MQYVADVFMMDSIVLLPVYTCINIEIDKTASVV
jgi:hypothetical protein